MIVHTLNYATLHLLCRKLKDLNGITSQGSNLLKKTTKSYLIHLTENLMIKLDNNNNNTYFDFQHRFIPQHVEKHK